MVSLFIPGQGRGGKRARRGKGGGRTASASAALRALSRRALCPGIPCCLAFESNVLVYQHRYMFHLRPSPPPLPPPPPPAPPAPPAAPSCGGGSQSRRCSRSRKASRWPSSPRRRKSNPTPLKPLLSPHPLFRFPSSGFSAHAPTKQASTTTTKLDRRANMCKEKHERVTSGRRGAGTAQAHKRGTGATIRCRGCGARRQRTRACATPGSPAFCETPRWSPRSSGSKPSTALHRAAHSCSVVNDETS